MSNQSRPIQTLSVTAREAITANRFVNADGFLAGAGGSAFGVALSDAVIGEQVPVVVLGTAAVTIGAGLSVDSPVEVGIGGKAVPWSIGEKVGKALEVGNADGETIEVFLIPNAAQSG